MKRSRRPSHRAFTLTEALIASVVLAISVLGIGSVLAASSSQSDTTVEATTTAALGRQLLEEIAAKPFPIAGVTTAVGWSGGNRIRSTYDDVADYDGYTDSSPFTALSGVAIPTAGTYTRSVTFTRRVNPSDTPSTSGNFGLITVKVLAPSGNASTFSMIVADITQVRS